MSAAVHLHPGTRAHAVAASIAAIGPIALRDLCRIDPASFDVIADAIRAAGEAIDLDMLVEVQNTAFSGHESEDLK